MESIRETIIDRLMRPYRISAAEVLRDADIARGCTVVEDDGHVVLVTGAPLMGNTDGGISGRASRRIAADDVRAMVADATTTWLPFILAAMRKVSLRRQLLGAPMRPSWSILVNAVTLAAATATDIPAARLARCVRKDGLPSFPGLHDDGFEDHLSTAVYVRDDSHHEGADYLRGEYMRSQNDYVINHALQLLEDTRFPIRSVSDQNGAWTMLEVRRLLPETTCAALVGRPLSDLLEIPGFGPGTVAGSCIIKGATPKEANGRTVLDVQRRRVPATTPPADADMRWAAAWAKG